MYLLGSAILRLMSMETDKRVSNSRKTAVFHRRAQLVWEYFPSGGETQSMDQETGRQVMDSCPFLRWNITSCRVQICRVKTVLYFRQKNVPKKVKHYDSEKDSKLVWPQSEPESSKSPEKSKKKGFFSWGAKAESEHGQGDQKKMSKLGQSLGAIHDKMSGKKKTSKVQPQLVWAYFEETNRRTNRNAVRH